VSSLVSPPRSEGRELTRAFSLCSILVFADFESATLFWTEKSWNRTLTPGITVRTNVSSGLQESSSPRC
jgi:hypothetical protein